MIKSFCDEMGFPFDMTTLIHFMMQCIKMGWMLDIVEEKGEFIGMGGVRIASHFADVNYKMGVEFVWHSLPSLPKLKRAKIMLTLWDRMERFCDSNNIPLIIGVNEKGKSGGLGKRMADNKRYSLEESYFIREVI